MNLLLHDMAAAIERDATNRSDERSERPTSERDTWADSWRLRFDVSNDDLSPSSTTTDH